MTHWFYQRYQDPAHETPYESAEGGYLYIWGGPYEAKDELFDEFGAIISENRIDEAVEEVESDGITDWAPGRLHAAMRAREQEWDDEDSDAREPPADTDLAILIRNLQSGPVPKYGDEVEGKLRRKLLEDVEQLVKALAPPASHGGIGHNNPPRDDDNAPVFEIMEIGKAAETIRSELDASDPNALEVAKATSRLKAVLNWVGKKADIWAESFAKESGGAAGKWLTGILIAGITWQTLSGLVTSVVETATHWLHHITAWF